MEKKLFIMFKKDQEIVWSYVANELIRMQQRNPSGYISDPIEVTIPDSLDYELAMSMQLNLA